jgi:hypothetical protein
MKHLRKFNEGLDDREYHCEIFGRGVRIFPTEEKSFVELTSN